SLALIGNQSTVRPNIPRRHVRDARSKENVREDLRISFETLGGKELRKNSAFPTLELHEEERVIGVHVGRIKSVPLAISLELPPARTGPLHDAVAASRTWNDRLLLLKRLVAS